MRLHLYTDTTIRRETELEVWRLVVERSRILENARAIGDKLVF